MLCLIYSNSNTFELTVHTSCYLSSTTFCLWYGIAPLMTEQVKIHTKGQKRKLRLTIKFAKNGNVKSIETLKRPNAKSI